jgi:shikimate kinase
MSGQTDHIVVVGAMAAGKTTIGRGIAERLGLGFVDSDDQIVELTGNHAARVAETEGVPALHQLELRVFWAALDLPHPSVIAAAASVIEDQAVRDVLRSIGCVWVDAGDATRRLRQTPAGHRREITEEEAARLTKRDPLFASCANVRIDTSSVTEHDAVSIAVEAITGRDDG